MRIPFLSLQEQYQSIRAEMDDAVQRVLLSGQYLLGGELERFERRLADYCGAPYCAGVASGTDALMLALKACGVGEGDEVITVPNSFIATALAIHHAGAKPVFVDIDAETHLMDLSQIKQMITPKTKAVMPVHLFGQMVDVQALKDSIGNPSIFIIEDAAQCIGAAVRGDGIGAHSDAAAVSFYPTKNLGAFGDGGAVLTRSSDVDGCIRSLRFYGIEQLDIYDQLGYNSRLDEIQAAILTVKLAHLDEWNRKRAQLAALYDELLRELPLQVPRVNDGHRHVYHLYVIRCSQRDALKEHLASNGVETKVHYPTPIHLQPSMCSLGYRAGDFPNAERAARESLSLPLYPEMGEERVRLVCDGIRSFFS